MKKKVLIIQLITILSLSFYGVFGKPIAVFDTDVLAECTPVIAEGTLKRNGDPINNNDTICPGQVQYSSTSTGTVKWIFGDGSYTFSKSGTHDYTIPRVYTALLIASPDNSCADTLSWTFTVESLITDFSMSTEDTCLSPVNISFTDHSTNAISWEWTFDDGSKAFTKNVSHIYAIPPETDVYQINQAIVFLTTLKATNPNGCTSSKSKYLTIKKPTSIFTIDTASGCKPIDVLFTDKSLSDQAITNRRWIFDDGSIVDAGNSVTHSYNSEGEYDARLVITNSSNCSDTSYSIRIGVGKLLKPDFTVSNANPCPNETIQFIDNTPEPGLIQGWHYFVNGLSVAGSINTSSPYWKVVANPGLNDVQLQVDYNGCISDTVKENFLLVEDPMSDFSFSFSCEDPFNYNFTNLSQGYSSFEWKFGDGQTDNSTVNPNNTYASENNYLVELITHNGSCYDTASKMIKVREPKAAIVPNSIPCAGIPVVFKGNTSYSMVDYCFEKYYWYFADTLQNIRTNIDSVSHTFPDRGNYTIKLFTNYDNGCIDSAIQNISTFKPYVGFEADILYGCSPLEVNFTDTSYADTHPLVLWNWIFDDGTDSSYNVLTNPINHLFVNPEEYHEYHVVLSVTDNIGCIGTHTTTVATANPDATFTVDSAACAGEEVLFNYNYTTGDSAIWNFGDGTIVRDLNIPASHTYQTQGNYTVELTIYKYACAKTTGKEIEIFALPSISISADTFSCAGHGVEISAMGGDIITWWPAEGLSNPNAYTTLASPDNTTIYTAIVTDTATNCSDSSSLEVLVQQRPPEIKVSPADTVILVGEKIYIKADSVANFIYTWSPVEGLSCINCASPIAMTSESIAYLLEVSDSNNCFKDIYNVNITIEEISVELPTAFSPNGDGINDIVFIRSGGIDKILEFRIYNRWGNEVFYINDVVYNTDDIAQGWDGTYKGKPQNIDTYAYTVKVLMLNGSIVEKKGMINLLK